MNSAVNMLDFYKTDHRRQYPDNTTLVYSNFTPRSSRLANVIRDRYDDTVIFFGLQAFIKDYLIREWNETFFNRPKEEVLKQYKRRMDTSLGVDAVSVEHLEDLHNLGYLPIAIKALPEGTHCPIRVPVLTIYNTNPDFFWLTNYLESVMSTELWKPCTTATIANEYRKMLLDYAQFTGSPVEFVPFQGHDFSFRGMSGRHDAMSGGAGHLTSFVGTDTVPAIDYVEEYYNADAEQELIGTSVPATEHSVMCMGGQEDEIETFRRLIKEVYPSGIVSIVSDTWDYFGVITEFTRKLKEEILTRDPDVNGNAKVVFRPDCYDDQTEILTTNGWKYFRDLTENDLVAQVTNEGYRSWVKPYKIVNQPYKGLMHHFTDYHGKVDLLVTPNHRMVLIQDGKERIVEAEKLGVYGHHKQKMVRSAPAGSNPDLQLSDLERLKIAFQADGSYVTKSMNHIRFSFAKQRKIDRMKTILHKLNADYSMYDLADGKVEFNIRIDATQFQKDMSWVSGLQFLSKEWCEQFIEECSYWDSCRRSNDRFKFDTTNINVLDVVYDIALGAGYGVLQSSYEDERSDNFSTVHTLHILKDNTVGGQSWKHETTHYDGRVYCVQVPTGRVLIRRNRCTMVCGNSGDPVKIICGDPDAPVGTPEHKGSLECLWEVFGGTKTAAGYRVLDPHVGLIYGDSITLERCRAILSRMTEAGFASCNIVFGIGSFTYQYLTRDTFGFAMKATYGEVDHVGREIFKDPKTDNGVKKSAKGLLRVDKDEHGKIVLHDQQSWQGEKSGLLREVFRDGRLLVDDSFSEIRKRVQS